MKDDTVPGENRRFTGGAQQRKDSVGANIPHQLFMRSLEVLRSEKADPTVRLSSDQAASIEKISRELRESQRAYIDQHRAEIAELREKAGPELRRRIDNIVGDSSGRDQSDRIKQGKSKTTKGDAPVDEKSAAPDGEKNIADAAIKARAAELLDGAPKAADAHTKIWAVLTASQRPVVEKEMARLKTEIQSRRDGKKSAGKPADAAKQGTTHETPDLSTLPPKMQERLRNMSPEERQKALEKYAERQKAKKDKE